MVKTAMFSLTLAAVVALCFGNVDSAFVASREGMAFVTAIYDENGDKSGEERSVVRSVTRNKDGAAIVVDTRRVDKDSKVINYEMAMAVVKGVVVYDLSSVITTVFGQEGLSVRVTRADKLRLPPDIMPGDTLEDATMTFVVSSNDHIDDADGMELSLSALVTNHKCVAIDTVTVPAGTFETRKITYDFNATVSAPLEMKIKTTAVEWYARGIGVVKSISESDEGRTLTELVRIERN